MMGRGARLGGVVLLLAGCGDSSAEEANEALARWKERGPSSYVYVMSRTSQSSWLPEEMRIVVKGGFVIELTGMQTGLPHGDEGPTMTDVMEEVARAAAHDNARFDATYSEDLGYVRELKVDGDEETVDDELYIRVSCLAAGTTDDVCPLRTVPRDECPGEATEVVSDDERPLCSDRERPIGRIADSELVCCPGSLGRTCAQIQERVVAELETIKECETDDDCGTGPLEDCRYAVSLDADARLFVRLLEDAETQACELDFGAACVPLGRSSCDEGRCEIH